MRTARMDARNASSPAYPEPVARAVGDKIQACASVQSPMALRETRWWGP